MRRDCLTQPAFLADLNLLAQFDSKNLEQGLKLHQGSDDALRASALRLHAKGQQGQGGDCQGVFRELAHQVAP